MGEDTPDEEGGYELFPLCQVYRREVPPCTMRNFKSGETEHWSRELIPVSLKTKTSNRPKRVRIVLSL